jgi:putative transposase
MAHTYVQNIVHVVFSTKQRLKLIPREFQPRMWAYVAGVCNRHAIGVQAIGGMADHMHALIQIPATMAVAKAVGTIKANSSRWVNEQGMRYAWQEGYAAFSVSASNVPAVANYIRNQEAHHKRRPYDQEILALLRKHGVEFDSEFVFG